VIPALRPELASWATELDLFSGDVALALDGMCARLGVAIGPMRAPPQARDGEPDGFDGLGTRGLYERLMLSEWLLASEMPEEFDRRAAMGEHLFLKLARNQPEASRASVALFDSSASQLGTPRIVQIALLVTLARRAAARGARFAWGLLEQPESALFERIDTRSVRELLAARRASRLRSENVERWLDRMKQELGRDAEVWLIGGVECIGRARNVITVRDTLEAQIDAVHVQVSSRAAPLREVVLEMPESKLGARIVRDPFADAPPMRAIASAQPVSNLVFSGNGVKLFARGANDTIIMVPVPNSPRAQPGRIRVFPTRGTVLAAGSGPGKHNVLVREPHGGLSVRADPSRVTLATFSGSDALPIGDALAPLHHYRFAGVQKWTVLSQRTLYTTTEGRRWRALATNVLDLVSTGEGYDFIAERVCIGDEVDGWHYVSSDRRSAPKMTPLEVRGGDTCAAFISRPIKRSFAPTFGFTSDGATWDIFSHDGHERLNRSGGDVIALTGSNIRDAAFVIVDDRRRTIRIEGRDQEHTLVRAASTIIHTAVSAQGTVAWLTEDNELGFASLSTRTVFQQRKLWVKP
jgi:hypothetical protein